MGNNPAAASLMLGVTIESMSAPFVTIPLALPAAPLPVPPGSPMLPPQSETNGTAHIGNAENLGGSEERLVLFGGAAGLVLLLSCSCVLRKRLLSSGHFVQGSPRQVYPQVYFQKPQQSPNAIAAIIPGRQHVSMSRPHLHTHFEMQVAPHVHTRPQGQTLSVGTMFVQTKVPRS